MTNKRDDEFCDFDGEYEQIDYGEGGNAILFVVIVLIVAFIYFFCMSHF